MKGWNQHCQMIGKKMKGWNRHCQLIGKKMIGWKRRCRMISKKKGGRIQHCRFIESFSDDQCPPLASGFKSFELCFGNLQFFWIEAVGFCKNGGVATSVDVMLDPIVRYRLHIPSA
jgi:hypothetical protein